MRQLQTAVAEIQERIVIHLRRRGMVGRKDIRRLRFHQRQNLLLQFGVNPPAVVGDDLADVNVPHEADLVTVELVEPEHVHTGLDFHGL